MFEFFTAGFWWFLIVIEFIALLVFSLGVFGQGASRNLIIYIGFFGSLAAIISQFIYFGFAALILGIVLWFILKVFTDKIIIHFLSQAGIVHSDPELAAEIERLNNQEISFDLETMMKENNHQKAQKEKALENFSSVKNNFDKFGLDQKGFEEFVDLVQYYLGNISYTGILKLAQIEEIVETFSEWYKLITSHAGPNLDKDIKDEEVSKELERLVVDFTYMIKTGDYKR